MIDLHALQTLLEDEALVQKYLHRFREEMPVLLQNIKAAFSSRHFHELSILAHSYKSQMQYIHDHAAAGIAIALEKESATHDPDLRHLETLILQLEVQLSSALTDIHQLIG
jgi:hypothetical protein